MDNGTLYTLIAFGLLHIDREGRMNSQRMLLRRLFLLGALTTGLIVAWGSPAHAEHAEPANILVIIGDDMGIETLGSFGVGADTPTTATLDALAEGGVSFNNMWAQPVCSPTRATILTGRYGFRTGVGAPVGPETLGHIPEPPAVPSDNPVSIDMGMGMGSMGASGRRGGVIRWGITLDEFTLTQAFNTRPDLGYDKAAFGKWHLADTRNGWNEHPNLIGFDHFAGPLNCCVENFAGWVKVTNGEFSTETGYAPTAKVDDAIAWLGDPAEREEPWFLWLAFNTPHGPIHMPPRELLQSDDPALDDPESGSWPYFKAMIEAMDTEIGRLLEHIGPEVLENTYVIFIGDNGTVGSHIRAPFRQSSSKSTVYNGGVAVPFLIAGPGVAAGETSYALANSTDLYATILDMAGIDIDRAVPDNVTLDSVSLMPYLANPDRESIREWIYADRFTLELGGVRGGDYAIRDTRYKFLVEQGAERFFDLSVDPYEHVNLLDGELSEEEYARYDRLRDRVDALHASEL